MDIVFTEDAKKEYSKLDKSVKENFKKHIKKISKEKVNRRHLRLGIPFYVENVSSSSRIIYDIDGNVITIFHFYINHKDYEDWYHKYE